MRKFLWLGSAVIVVCAIIFAVPSSRQLLLGLVRGEPFDDNRPLGYWMSALKDPDPETRREAAFRLGRIGGRARDAVPTLGELLKDNEPRVRVNAALALYKIGPDALAALPALCGALKDNVPLVRMDAAMTLSRFGPDGSPAVPDLIEAAKNPENRESLMGFGFSVRQEAIFALGRIGAGARDALPMIREALDDEDEQTRQAAATALPLIQGAAVPEGAAP
jgi:HEAT repeat protein